MLDIKFIRENPTLVRDAARKKHITFDVEKLIDLDKTRREMMTEVEAMRAQLNATSAEIAKIEDEEAKKKSIEEVGSLKTNLKSREEKLAKLNEEYEVLMYTVPNIPDPSVPDGKTDENNVEVRKVGDVPAITNPKDHITLLKDLDLADFERGTKVAGFRGYFLKNEAVILSMALWQFAMSELRQKGFTPLTTPSLANDASFLGTGYFPQGKEDVYQTQDDLSLIGTSEVSTMGMFRDEILKQEDFPKKFAAFSSCYRREAGAHGKDTKGLYRVHEFWKVEQVVLCQADHMESVRLHEEITANAEDLLQKLGLHYRVVLNCGGDLGQGQVKKYDIETWIPSQQKYGETHSASYFHDFQTRRLGIRYKDSDGKMKYAHSLNNTALASPRILINILEQYQTGDGTIKVPEVLQKYTGFDVISRE